MRKMSPEGVEKKRLGRVKKYGLCGTCGERAASAGKGTLPTIARLNDQCIVCCRASMAEVKQGDSVVRHIGPGEPGDLQRFVDGLIARSPGVQDEVRRIARVQKHRKYIRERVARGVQDRKGRVHRSPTSEETSTRLETKRRKGIDLYGVCKTCGKNPIAHGDNPSSQRAGIAEQCRTCYNKDHARKSNSHSVAGAKYTSKLVLENGLCLKCECHAIAGGVSEISVLARDVGLCLYCYRDSRTRRSETPRKKICRKCCVARVAPGPSPLAVVARRKGLCLKCHHYVDGETEE